MDEDLIGALGRYAARLHETIGDSHHVASPLGAWLLLALTAARDTGGELAETLGVEPARAAEMAAALLNEPHPLVAAATAMWHTANATDQQAWREALPEATEFGPVPDKAGLDRWAREHTLGLIDRFPGGPDPRTLLMLAGALATRVPWENQFAVTSASQLGDTSPWASSLTHVLHGYSNGGTFVARTRDAGHVIVHAAPAVRDHAILYVVSVAAADDVPALSVLAAAQEIAVLVARGRQQEVRVPLRDLPLGETPLWRIWEGTAYGDDDKHSAVLPCWTAAGEHDLSAAGLGFDVAGRLLGGDELQAVQVTVARYGRAGFEAAGLTTMRVGGSLPERGLARFAELRFGHPHAVVAVTAGEDSPWHGVPVFSAWVSEPEDVPEQDLDEDLD
ncbi:hypothetical protein FB565_002875 [Actinoplanes lutulentus]|uniref:Serpin (Serine protease inhibitor) n=1 Tax=Actinoplanes lutulentus TaxID=1287878 RepID=A0A327YW77_9ACTN|nr:hypothetical protein [Actinoplanes lutulentus]MBB2943162.1 hypothetical protein [Actinoplanes lutulentus]RAK25543.1 hypothetical protein B0I29_1325 [Actinoplanes lutulentus]